MTYITQTQADYSNIPTMIVREVQLIVAVKTVSKKVSK